jgi:hypothetical protein
MREKKYIRKQTTEKTKGKTEDKRNILIMKCHNRSVEEERTEEGRRGGVAVNQVM